MPRFGLTPQEVELKKVISARLNALLSKTPYKKADVVRQTGISESTVYDYFNGKALPSPESIDKLADFFHVSKEEIDPRFAISPENVVPVDQSHLVKIPLIGHIACGEPINAQACQKGK